MGQKRTFLEVCSMSALLPKADITAAQTNVRFVPKADSCTATKIDLFDYLVGVHQDWGRQFDAERQGFSARCANHVPLMFIATGKKARMSRLETIFAVVAWYFLK